MRTGRMCQIEKKGIIRYWSDRALFERDSSAGSTIWLA